MSARIYTIGHSSQSIEAFVALLQAHDIGAIADVRSRPFSRWHPQFSKDALETSLKAAAIRYVFLGHELGARRDEPECYVDGQARYDLIARLPAFAAGLQRVIKGASQYRLALMCAEKDPLTCHRTILVCHELKRFDFAARHILRDGQVEEQEPAERRLIEEELGHTGDDLFTPRGALEQAYAQRAAQMAYRLPQPKI